MCEQSGAVTFTLHELAWFASVPLLFIGGWCVLGNLWIVGQWVVCKKRASLVPIVGGLALALGVLVLPVLPWSLRWRLALAALLIDISIAELLFVAVVWAIPPLRRRTLDRRPEEGAQADERVE